MLLVLGMEDLSRLRSLHLPITIFALGKAPVPGEPPTWRKQPDKGAGREFSFCTSSDAKGGDWMPGRGGRRGIGRAVAAEAAPANPPVHASPCDHPAHAHGVRVPKPQRGSRPHPALPNSRPATRNPKLATRSSQRGIDSLQDFYYHMNGSPGSYVIVQARGDVRPCARRTARSNLLGIRRACFVS